MDILEQNKSCPNRKTSEIIVVVVVVVVVYIYIYIYMRSFLLETLILIIVFYTP